ncbi:hypothetical protein SAMN04488503_0135, partial [Humidesulfovibrio mexicanus]
PELGTNECALVVEVGDDVAPGWLWTPEGCTAPPEPDPWPSAPDYLDAAAISIGHAERLYAAAQAEAAVTDAQGNPGDGPATVLLEILGL